MTCEIREKLTEDCLTRDLITFSKVNSCEAYKGSLVGRSCQVISTGKKAYVAILKDIWKNMTREQIFDDTKYKLRDGRPPPGWRYFAPHSFSFRSKDAPSTLKEILRLSKKNGYCLTMSITTRRDRNFTINIR